jgi:hypothetical protein
MPVVDVFPARLRGSMEALYDTDLDQVFHTARTRNRLEARVTALAAELHQVRVWGVGSAGGSSEQELHVGVWNSGCKCCW